MQDNLSKDSCRISGCTPISRRAALGAAALSLAALAPERSYADEAFETFQVADASTEETLLINIDAPADSWRFQNGMPIEADEANADIVPLADFVKWGKNDAGEWINSLGEPIPGALLRGVDVSYWQKTIDWNAAKSDDVNFAIIRAAAWAGKDSKGEEGADTYWPRNASECERLGIPYGAYIYSYATSVSDAIYEADYLLQQVKGHKPTYPLYIDLEDSRIAKADLNAIAAAFCERIEAAGYQAGIYANLNWWETKLTDPKLGSWSRWVAQYNITCDYQGQKDLWQATSHAAVSGIKGAADVSFAFTDLLNPHAGQGEWARVYGQDQIDTMQNIAQSGWASSDTVVVVTDATFWDALSASSLAGLYGCPIILTKKNALSRQASEEIRRLGAKTAYVCGGPIAISSAVDGQIRSAGCPTVKRLYGQDQQGTAKVIAEHVRTGYQSDTCIIATAWKFQDALSVSPFAYATKSPIYLCRSGSNDLSQEVIASIKAGGYKRALIVGGPIAVNSHVESQLASAGIPTVIRKYGKTEYETSKAIAEWELGQGMTVAGMGLATGATFYDALAGAALCGKENSVLVIADDSNRVCISDFIGRQRGNVQRGRVFGGPIAVSERTWDALMRSYFG